ncbi:phosphoribosylglycinamide formyltransferase-1 [Evansella caseinilytica]|uniref:Phosphoribosylglycinamide formyltransferase n=1 Tax=Evansella caseinilytica TaxID=1503961 RepID=A0A1H3G057_9BACI|nr:phosphoribosylglycinamide formyltransferase [Evansella caseinilytica]SDX96703.1 phosphoribosylglycinamide formyltransferase-1 [Evansella caseinilytica]
MNLAVFASGSGSNFEAIIEAINNGEVRGEIKLLVCDHPGAYAVKRAEKHGIPVFTAVLKTFASKAAFEEAVLAELRKHEVELVILAGFMRLIGPVLLSAYEQRILNIHPSLLPAFPGLDAIGQAFAAGVKVSGVTVHYVDAGMDTGPIIAQECVKIDESDTIEDLQRNIQRVEHQLYPQTIQQVIEQIKGSVHS